MAGIELPVAGDGSQSTFSGGVGGRGRRMIYISYLACPDFVCV